MRWTLAAVCLVLLVLGGSDVAVWARNQQPHRVALAELERGSAPAAWLHIEGGRFDLAEAISTSGTVELEALLVPLTANRAGGPVRVLVETRDPKALELFGRLHLGLDTPAEREEFLRAKEGELRAVRDVTGMVLTGLTARANRDALLGLAREAGFQVSPQALFIIEGKEPQPVRGFAFLLLGALGVAKLVADRFRKAPALPRP
ncbi:MAG: hypothetical protein HY901_36750 [Deltaproteobacteria bacterium]|nr:hypothetical protein [Deltaproteobacteria bacterium]